MLITKVYKFGLLPPTLNVDIVNEQMFKAHRYHNQLIKIENDRRELGRKIDGNICEEIANLEFIKQTAEDLLKNSLLELGKSHSENRSKITSKEDKDKIAEIKKNIKKINADLKLCRQNLKNDPKIKEEWNKLKENTKIIIKDARKNCGVYWGTYLLKENALDAAAKKQPIFKNIHFKKWNGNGKIGINIPTAYGNVSINSIYEQKCTLFQIDPINSDIYYLPRGERKRQSRTKLRIRIGSIGKTIQPLWAEFPMIMHREIPINSEFLSATVSRNVFASKQEWTVEITVRFEDNKTIELENKSEAVAIDIGWRKIDNELRIGTWKGTDNEIGFINLSENIIGKFKKVDDLKQIRQNQFNKAKEMLLSYCKSANIASYSTWFIEKTTTLPQWKSINRLAIFVKQWKDNRFDGDGIIYDALEKWRYQDHHLWNWETNQRRSVLRERKEYYRNIASNFANQYKNVILEDFNLSKIAMTPTLEKNENDNETARSNRFIAAVSEFRLALELTFGKNCIVKINPANTSKICNKCKSIENIGQDLRHVCSKCECEYDRDENAVSNILELGMEKLKNQIVASNEVVPEVA